MSQPWGLIRLNTCWFISWLVHGLLSVAVLARSAGASNSCKTNFDLSYHEDVFNGDWAESNPCRKVYRVIRSLIESCVWYVFGMLAVFVACSQRVNKTIIVMFSWQLSRVIIVMMPGCDPHFMEVEEGTNCSTKPGSLRTLVFWFNPRLQPF